MSFATLMRSWPPPEHLPGFMEPGSRWPEGLTVEENLIDLAWHHREFTLRHSFAYTVLDPAGERCLGCAYLYPSDRAGFDAMAFYWARGFDADLDRRIGAAFRSMLRAGRLPPSLCREETSRGSDGKGCHWRRGRVLAGEASTVRADESAHGQAAAGR